MEVKRTIKTDVESFEMGDVISFTLKDGEKVQAEAVKQTDEGMRIGATNTFDLLRIPTEKEIFGENRYGTEESDTVVQFKGMKNSRNRIAFQGSETGSWVWYWLQNRVDAPSFYFARVTSSGRASYNSASDSLGVRPVFLLS